MFDLVVIGGGIHGVAATLEASRRGIRTALIEQDDFGSATSRNSLRVLHGGLRHLQSLDLRRFRESVGDRAFFLREFPELTEPMRFVLPLDGKGLRRPAILRVALGLNDWASRSLQEDLPPAQALRPGEVWPRDLLRARYPEIADEQFVGAAVWSDGHLSSPQRVLMEMLRWADAGDAVPVNHARVEGCRTGSGVLQLKIRDRVHGHTLQVRAQKVLICAGPWSRQVLSICSEGDSSGDTPSEAARGGSTRFESGRSDAGISRAADHLHPLSLSFNLVLRGSLPRPFGIGLTSLRGRNLFLWEREGLIHLGTCHTPWPTGSCESPLDRLRPSTDEVQAFLAEASDAAPGLALHDAEIVRVESGTLTATSVGAIELAHRDAVVLHRDYGGLPGVASVHGVKYTSAPSAALAALRKLWGTLPPRSTRPRPESRGPLTATTLVQRLDSDRSAVHALLADLRQEEWVTSNQDLLEGRVDGTEDPLLTDQLRAGLASTVES